jgi:hypothetical protein
MPPEFDPHEEGADFLLPAPRQKNSGHPTRRELDDVVRGMNGAAASATAFADGLVGITQAARFIVSGSGLGPEALYLLIQNKAGFAGHNRAQVPIKSIEAVLRACSELHEFLDKEALQKAKEKAAKKGGGR